MNIINSIDIDNEDSTSDSSSSLHSNSEHDIFDDESITTVSSSTCKWSDSDEDETHQRRDYKIQNNINWDTNPKKLLPKIENTKKNIKLTPRLFKTNNHIKLVKRLYEHGVVIITTFNDIYILTDLASKAYSIMNLTFNISDFIVFNDKIVAVSMKCGYIKEITLADLTCRDIPMGSTKKYKKIVYNTEIYMLSDVLEKRDARNYDLIRTFKEEAVDFSVCEKYVMILRINKTIAVYERGSYDFVELIKYQDKYFIKSINKIEDVFMVMMDYGIRIECKRINKNVIDLFKGAYKYVTSDEEYLYVCGDRLNDLKVLRLRDLKNVTPGMVSKFMIDNVKGICHIDKKLYIMHNSFISRIDIF